jgi:hypothetical protein
LASEPLEPQAGYRILARVAEAPPPLRIRPVVPGFKSSIVHIIGNIAGKLYSYSYQRNLEDCL